MRRSWCRNCLDNWVCFNVCKVALSPALLKAARRRASGKPTSEPAKSFRVEAASDVDQDGNRNSSVVHASEAGSVVEYPDWDLAPVHAWRID
jgi:hypothetical protein